MDSLSDILIWKGQEQYRNILAGKTLEVKFKAFNVGDDGLQSPMLMKIEYVDVLASPVVSTYINFIHDPDKYGDDIVDHGYNRPYHSLGPLSKMIACDFCPCVADSKWSTKQYLFARTQFQLLRAINDYFTIRIANSSSIAVPIRSITLTAISASEYETLKHEQMLDGYAYKNACAEGSPNYRYYPFGKVELPDAPSTPVDYSGSDLVVFARDPMQPVFNWTVPDVSEAVSDISVSSAPGETEPVSLSIYAPKADMTGLQFSVSDLANEDGTGSISASKIEVKQVVHEEKRAAPYMWIPESRSYNIFPDYLDDLETMDVPSGGSKSVWIKVHVPSDASGGNYKGSISIKQNGTLLRTVGFKIYVLPISLDGPLNINLGHTSPYTLGTIQVEPAIKMYKEIGFEPFIWESNGEIKTSYDLSSKTFLFDTSILEKKVKRMVDEGIIKQHAAFLIWKVRTDILNLLEKNYPVDKLYGVPKEADLYERLTDERFAGPFKQAVTQLVALAKKYNFEFLFSCADEPGSQENLRILCDRIDTHVKAAGGTTTVTYFKVCEDPLSITHYSLPIELNGAIPSLSPLIDYKIWTPGDQDLGYEKNYPNYGYYTTNSSYLSSPIYNRFSHGFLPYVTDAKLVLSYAINGVLGDPFNDFDMVSSHSFPDFELVYPTWSGKILYRLALEGIREGIKDSKYIATLQRLINENPTLAASQAASSYLAGFRSKIDKKFEANYVEKWHAKAYDAYKASGYKLNSEGLSGSIGYYKEILKNISPTSSESDYRAFTRVRNDIIGHIKQILIEKAAVEEGEGDPADDSTDDPGTSEGSDVADPSDTSGSSVGSGDNAGTDTRTTISGTDSGSVIFGTGSRVGGGGCSLVIR